jgi:hypothetical protein
VPKDQDRKINFRGDPAVLFVKMDLMKTQLLDVKFDKLIKENELLLPANVRRNFNNFTQQLLCDKEENVFLFIENWEWFSLNTRTPKPVNKLLKEIEKHMGSEKNSKKKKRKLAEFGRRIRWKWCEAAFKYAYYAEVEKNGNFLSRKHV